MKNKKKLLPICLSGIMLFSTIACGKGSSGSSAKGPAIVWSALSTEKYIQDEEVESYGEAKLDFVGMKGETTAMQLMITANEYIKSFDLEVSDLTGADGAVFSADNFAVYAEKYVEVYRLYTNNLTLKGNTIYRAQGFYPDALVPIDRYIANAEARIEAGNNQGIWVDCVIPADATPGSYSGSFTLSYGTETKEIPVTLNVYDLTMPEEVHSRTMFGLWYEQLAYGEGDMYTAETNQIYYDFLASKRAATDDVPSEYLKSVSTFIEFIAKAAENPKVTTYVFPWSLIGANKSIISPSPADEAKYDAARQLQEEEKLQTQLTKHIGSILTKNLELRAEEGKEDIDLLKKLIFMIEDEPGSDYRRKKVKIMGERLTAAKRAVLEQYETQLAEHPDLAESIKNIQQICAVNAAGGTLAVSSKNADGEEYVPDYEKGDGLTTWCPEQHKFKEATFREQVKQRQALGETVIWYNCCSTSPTMSYYLETVPVSMRMFSWMQYEYGVKGVLYWDTVHWTTTVTGDPYEDVCHSNGWGSGEGILLYPGVKYGLKTPISSIRLEQFFHGQQDYEYFYMLDGYLQANEIETTASEIITPLLTNMRNNALVLETAKSEDLEAGRIKVLDLLQDFANGDVAAAQAKIDAILG